MIIFHPFEHQTLVLELHQTIMCLRPLSQVLPPIKKPPMMTCCHWWSHLTMRRKHQFFLSITGETAIKSPSTTSRSLRTSIKKSPHVLIISHTPVLFYSCPVLQATHETICKIHVALKGIRSHTTGITTLKLNTIQSLDNLEVHWTELSSPLADNQPLEYSTVHHFASTMHHYSIIIQISSYFKLFSLSTEGC